MVIYHYTNIDTLALILKNKSIRFSRLDKVDDPEESDFISSNTGINLGIYTFVSCWTENKEESIPMWKMYTDHEYGVRISLNRDGMFKEYTLDYMELNGLKSVSLGNPIKILFPQKDFFFSDYTLPFYNSNYETCQFYRKINYVDDVKQHAISSTRFMPKDDNKGFYHLDYGSVGTYKNKRWSFQEESRFVLTILPGNTLCSFNTSNYDHEANKFIRNIVDNKPLEFCYYDMFLDDNAFDSLEITLSPFSTEAEKIIVHSLCSTYAPQATIHNSSLNLRK